MGGSAYSPFIGNPSICTYLEPHYSISQKSRPSHKYVGIPTYVNSIPLANKNLHLMSLADALVELFL